MIILIVDSIFTDHWSLRSFLGDFAQLLAVESRVGDGEQGSELSGGAVEWKTIRGRLAHQPTRRHVARWNEKITPQNAKRLAIFHFCNGFITKNARKKAHKTA
jgi:hypothetical protein